jgi:hypothetical protein
VETIHKDEIHFLYSWSIPRAVYDYRQIHSGQLAKSKAYYRPCSPFWFHNIHIFILKSAVGETILLEMDYSWIILCVTLKESFMHKMGSSETGGTLP